MKNFHDKHKLKQFHDLSAIIADHKEILHTKGKKDIHEHENLGKNKSHFKDRQTSDH
jgi:hypothetical protein